MGGWGGKYTSYYLGSLSQLLIKSHLCVYVCVCVCVCARARVCVCACVSVCVKSQQAALIHPKFLPYFTGLVLASP